MGQKTHPIGFRLGVTRTWDSRWYTKKNYAELLHEDILIRKELKKKLYPAGIARIEIERAANKVKVNIYSARPGLIIGKNGCWRRAQMDRANSMKNAQLQSFIKSTPQVSITIVSSGIIYPGKEPFKTRIAQQTLKIDESNP